MPIQHQTINEFMCFQPLNADKKSVWAFAVCSHSSTQVIWNVDKNFIEDQFDAFKKHCFLGQCPTQGFLFEFSVSSQDDPKTITAYLDDFLSNVFCNRDFVLSQLVECFPYTGGAWLSFCEQNEQINRFNDSAKAKGGNATIRAEAHSDDRVVELSFNAAPYFAKELKEGTLKNVIEELTTCEFGYDLAADTVAEYFKNHETKRLFDYMNFNSGYECSIEKEDVITWLKEFSPDLVSLID